MTTSPTTTLAERFWPASDATGKAVRAAVLVAAGSLLLVASAKTQVPFWPVPMTLQTLAVVLIGATYGSRLGALTLLAYLLEGAAGLPVFAGTPERGLGLAYMMGPTGGYLAGYLAAAFVAGRLTERGLGSTLPGVLLTVAAATGTIYLFGLAWLATAVDADKLLAAGLLPFVPAELLKMALAASLVLALHPVKLR